MEAQFIEKLNEIERTYLELGQKLSEADPSDQQSYTRLAKQRRGLEPSVDVFKQWQKVQSEIEGAEEILKKEKDKELRELADAELQDLHRQQDGLVDKLRVLLLPRDPNDDKDIMVEIRAGTGGDEASIFAGDLLRMYLKYADRQRWKPQIESASEGEWADTKK